MLDIPSSRLVVCVYCADRLDSEARGTYQRALGWLPKKRATRNAIGTNSLVMPKLQWEFACEVCISKLKKGIPTGQQSLFKASGE